MNICACVCMHVLNTQKSVQLFWYIISIPLTLLCWRDGFFLWDFFHSQHLCITEEPNTGLLIMEKEVLCAWMLVSMKPEFWIPPYTSVTRESNGSVPTAVWIQYFCQVKDNSAREGPLTPLPAEKVLRGSSQWQSSKGHKEKAHAFHCLLHSKASSTLPGFSQSRFFWG